MPDTTFYPHLALDSSGGASLRGECGNAQEGRALVLKEPKLRALDVLGSERLEVLDLRGCGRQHHLHLALQHLPRLREIYLPCLSKGAVIHLAAERIPASLMIHGMVTEIDAAWPDGEFRTMASQGCWSDVRMLGSDVPPARLQEAGEEAGLVVALVPSLLTPALTLRSRTDWLLVNADGLEALAVAGSGRVTVLGARTLKRVNVQRKQRVQIEGANALQQAEGAGGDIVIKGKCRELALQGGWRDIQLHGPRLAALTVEAASQLTLFHCRQLQQITLPTGVEIACHGSVPTPLLGQARFYVDEATVSQTFDRLRAGEHALLPALLEMLASRSSPSDSLHALLALQQLCEDRYDPQAIWACRRQLSAHNQGGRKRQPPSQQASSKALARADANWKWELPRDRCDEGLEADLAIWRYCQAHCDQAHAYGKRIVEACCRPEAFKLLIHYATRPLAGQAVLELMLAAMQNTNRGLGNASFLEREASLRRHLVATFKRPTLHDDARQQILAFLSHTVHLKTLLSLLPLLLSCQPGLVRAQIMQLSRAPDDWFARRMSRFSSTQKVQDARSQLVQLALMPTQALNTPDTTVAMAEETHPC